MANNKNITFDQLQAALSRVKNALDGKANTNHGNHVPNIETANGARFLRNDNTWQTITPVDIGAAAVSHNHTSLTDITKLQFAAAPTDYAAIRVTTEEANTYLDFEMNDDAGSDMYRWRFSAYDTAGATPYFNLMTLTAKDTTSAILTVNGDVTASSFIGNASSATKLQSAKTLTIGNASRYFDGSANVTWSLSDIGAAADSHTHGSYINQNAFTNVKIGDTIIEADSPTDTLTLNAGANVTITPDATNDTVIIEAKDTIYTHPTNPGNRHIPSGGSSGQILRWSEDGTAAWGAENTTFTNGSIGGFTVTPNNLVGNNVGMTSSSGHGYAFWAGANGAENSESAPFKVGHEGKLYAYNAVLAGTLDGNATTATRLQAAHKFTIGNTERYFDGSADVAWTLDEIGAASVDHIHTNINHLGNVFAQSTGERASKDGLSMQLVYNNGYPYTYGNVLNLKGSGDGQLFVGWSGTTGGDAPVYVRSKRDAGDEWSRWAMLYSEAYPQPSVTGNAGTATRLETARTFTIGNTSRSFDGQHDVAWSLNDIGAAASSHSHSNYVPLSVGGNTTIVADSDASTTNEYIQLQAGHNYLRVTSSGGGGTVTQGADKLTFNGNVVYHAGNKPIAADIGALPLSGGTMTGAIKLNSAVTSTDTSAPTQLSYGLLGSYGNLKLLANTDDDAGANNEYVHIATARGLSPTTDQGIVVYGTYANAFGSKIVTEASGNAPSATKLQTARTLTIGNTGKNFDGSGNISWSLDEIGAVSPSHTHDRIVGSMSNVTISQSDDRCGLEARNNVDIATWYGFSISNNCYNTDNYGQVTFSVDARSGQVWTRGTISAPTFSGALQGNATTATTLFNSRKFTIGNTEKYFNGSADVSWSLDEMGVTSAIAQKGDVILNTVNQQINSAIDKAKSSVKMDMHHNYVSKHEAAHYFEGENKWKLDLYNMGSMDTMATPTKELMVQNNCQYLYSLLVEHPSYTSAYGDTYVGYATTYMHFTEAYQWTGQVATDDAGTVYLNDEFVLSTTSCQFKDITLNFRAGWNKIEVLYAEGGGGDGWQFNPEIIVVPGGIMNKMNCYGQNSIGERLNGSAGAWDNAYNRVAEWAYGSVGGSTTINGDKIQANTITAKQLVIGDFNNYSQLRPYENLSNRYGSANWGGGEGHFYWNNNDDEYLPFTINETANPFKQGDKVGFKFEAYAQVDLDITIGVWFYSVDDCNGYMAARTATVHLYPGWNSYSTQVTIDCNEVKYARSVAIMIYKGVNNYIEVRNVVISRMISNVMIEDGAVTANKLGTIGGFQVEDRLLRGRNGTEGNNYVGMSGDGFGWAFWAGAYNGGDAPFHVGHEGHLYATDATLAGTLDGNATTASRLQNARTLTIGNTGKNFDGSGNIAWSLGEIGAAPSSHGHNFMYTKGGNTINSIDNDTTGNWGAQETSVHFYTEPGLLHDQPSQWGYLLNIGQGSEVHQLWMTQASGNLLHRGGNSSGWSGSWKTILDSDNYSTWAAAKNHTHNYAASNHTHNYAGSSSAGGNANAAVKLATARSINGTNFDGSGNITTANWGTARTITIGGTGKSVNGSGNVSWSLSEIGALPTAGGTVSGNLNVTGAFSIGGKKITINSSAPSSPAVGDIWIKI